MPAQATSPCMGFDTGHRSHGRIWEKPLGQKEPELESSLSYSPLNRETTEKK